MELSAHITAASANDIKDLRLALDYLNWNLYGLEYGTRLALRVLRDYPSGVRSVVLDAVLLPPVGRWEMAAANANRAFDALVASCGQQPACNTAYPGLTVKFSGAADRLNPTPLTVQVPDPATNSLRSELLAGQTLVAGVGRMLADNSLSPIPCLPLTIAQIEAGNAGVAEGFAAAVAASPDVMHSGLWYSVQWS